MKNGKRYWDGRHCIKVECWKPTFPWGVNGTGVKVTKTNHEGKTVVTLPD